MKFGVGQLVSLLTIDGQPASGQSVIRSINFSNQTYTVDYYRNSGEPEVITDVSEGRLKRLSTVDPIIEDKTIS